MFDTMKRARADVATMNAVLPAAERMARDEGLEEPGAEHLLLAAVDLDDGIARRALGELGVDSAGLRAAVAAQHEDALRSIGVIADEQTLAAALPDAGPPQGVYRSQGSLQDAFQEAVALAKRDGTRLTSGHLLLATTAPDHGTVHRAVARLGLDADRLRERTRALMYAGG
jgi:ATP-dependent Clp protease ATP-binding subunit ClpA